MATKTAGTLATTTLTALQFPSFANTNAFSDADIATIANLILNDQSSAQGQIWPGAFSRMGLLYVPNRGVLKVLPGDWVAVTPDGWPILLADTVLPTTLTTTGNTNTSTSVTGLATSAITLGWNVGSAISSSAADIPAGTVITAISSDGKTLTLSKAATGSNPGVTLTVGSFTHS